MKECVTFEFIRIIRFSRNDWSWHALKLLKQQKCINHGQTVEIPGFLPFWPDTTENKGGFGGYTGFRGSKLLKQPV